jgi:membrane associated rhomboid family serine protease
MFGGMAAFVLLNWWKLPTQQRGYFICIVVFIIIMNFFFGLGASMSHKAGGNTATKDVLAHVGGLLAGICFGMWICEWKAQPTTHRKWEFVVKLVGYISSGLFVVLTVMGFTVFRTVKDIQM